MNNYEMNTSSTKNTTNSKIGEKFYEPSKLNEEKKKQLQVKDGQHNHHVDESGGA